LRDGLLIAGTWFHARDATNAIDSTDVRPSAGRVIAASNSARYSSSSSGFSSISALNLNLVYGFGEGVGYAIPRTLTGIDATVNVAVVSAALAWHAVAFTRLVTAPQAVVAGTGHFEFFAPANAGPQPTCE
jgi:hypothetical protein